MPAVKHEDIITLDPEVERFKKEVWSAVDYAHKCHAGQYRKGNNLPYIVHPLAVLTQLSEWGVTKVVTLKAGVCHDIREERPDISSQALVRNIGKDAASIVEELSFFPDETSNVPVSKQKEAYMNTFFEKSLDALVVKVADRVRNTWDFYHTESAYAGKYWRKGTPLMDALLTRAEQIEEAFGNAVLANMKYSRDTLNRMLVR